MCVCTKDFAEEFSCQNFALTLTPTEIEYFPRCLWLLSYPVVFCIWRTLAMILMGGIMIWSITVVILDKNGPWWLIYLTHWGLVFETAYLIAATFVTWRYASGPLSRRSNEGIEDIEMNERKAIGDGKDDKSKHGSEQTKQSSHQRESVQVTAYLIRFQSTKPVRWEQRISPPIELCIAWVLQDIIYVGSLLIFFLYWGIIYTGGPVAPISWAAHGVNFAVMFVDVILSGAPTRLLHIYIPFIVGITYIIWTFIHGAFALDNGNEPGIYIYEVFDYDRDPRAYGLAFAFIFVGLPVLYLVVWFIAYLARSAATWYTGGLYFPAASQNF
mmetsp:Transcript_24202/g.42818  ORF Transcript_24202/g.42818 Transcript_24202/m.42818 type:complete len:328 (-) Transcript_24202:253-1236(-)